jgi:hypothetical protein
MKSVLIAAGLAIALAGCESGEVERDAETGMAVDTVVTQRTVQDTSIVTTDTNVTVDTSVSRGDSAVGGSDTLVDTRAGDRWTPPDSAVPPADSQRLQRQPTP